MLGNDDSVWKVPCFLAPLPNQIHVPLKLKVRFRIPESVNFLYNNALDWIILVADVNVVQILFACVYLI